MTVDLVNTDGARDSDAATIAALFCVDPCGLGGVALRADAGPERDGWLRLVAALMPVGAPLRRMPLNIEADRLIGGLDLAATLSAGRPIAQPGMLVESDGGIVIVCMAERIAARTAALLASVLDVHEVAAQRDQLASQRAARIGLVMLDEGINDEEQAPGSLLDRLAFRLVMVPSSHHMPEPLAHGWTRDAVAAARALQPAVQVDDHLQQALCAAALALGIDSMRAPLLALRVARVHAALHGRTHAGPDDAAIAARLVLLPRANALPAETTEAADKTPPANTPEAPALQDKDETASATDVDTHALEDAVLEAASVVLPHGLLELLTVRRGTGGARSKSEGRCGEPARGRLRGRPDGVVRGQPRSGARLSLIDTLRAAAPWQMLRRATDPSDASPVGVRIHRDDFRIARFKQRSETTTLFAVDASGSAALHRMGEAKGAVELLLIDCYVRRDSVCLIAFRGRCADVLLPPTRSLVRARRSLAGLAGGGGTPLAAAINATHELARALRRRGRTPVAVLLTDGCANVALDGSGGRQRAGEDAMQSARLMRASGIRTLVLDTSPHPQEPARRLAGEMGATYIPLPYADAAALSRLARAAGELGR